jgi:hypothetical protein
MRYLIFITGLFFIVGCNNKTSTPSGILGREKMQLVMWDMIRAEVYTEQFMKKDSSKNIPMENLQLQNAIFSIHQVTRSQYYKSYDYYISHTDLIRVVLDSMSAKADRDKYDLFKPIEIGKPIEKFSMLKKAEVVGQFNYLFNPFLYSSKK